MSSPLALLFLDQYATLGGGQRILCGMVNRALERGYRVGVAIPEGPLRPILAALGAEVYALDVPALENQSSAALSAVRMLAGLWRIRTQMEHAVAAFSPDLIHVNGARVLPATFGLRSIPVIFHAHTVQAPWSAAVTRYLLRRSGASRVIAPSNFMAGWVQKSYGIDPSEIFVVSNWADPQFLYAAHPMLGQSPLKVREEMRVGVIGRITRIKGQIDALKAVQIARESGLDIRLVVAGRPDEVYLEELRALAAGSVANLEVLDAVDDVVPLLLSLDIALVPSLCEESFGLAAVEAMALGVPVVAYDSGALPEVIGAAGVLVPVGDVGQLAASIIRLAGDPAERERLGEAGRDRVSARFDFEIQADKLCDLFDAVVTRSNRG